MTTELAFLPDVGPNDAGYSGMCVTRPSACGSQGNCSFSSCMAPCVDAICDPIPGYQTAMLVVSGEGQYYRCLLLSDAL